MHKCEKCGHEASEAPEFDVDSSKAEFSMGEGEDDSALKTSVLDDLLAAIEKKMGAPAKAEVMAVEVPKKDDEEEEY